MQGKIKRITTKQLCFMGLMIAMNFVLGLMNVQITPQLRISLLAFLPIALVGAFMGPFWGAVAGGLGDVVNFLLLTHVYGGYFPGYTLSAALSGLCYGLFLYRKKLTWQRAAVCLVIPVFVCEMGLNTLWTYVTASWGYFISNLPWRVATNVMEFPLKVVLLAGMGKLIARLPASPLD